MLPLRGWANVTMHMPVAPEHSAVVTGAAHAACHGDQADTSSKPSVPACSLCDLCNGMALSQLTSAVGTEEARHPMVGLAPSLRLAGEPPPFFRPPRA